MGTISKLSRTIISHKIASGIVAIILLAGSYYTYSSLNKDQGSIKYITSAVKKGTIISSTTGSGQVSVSNQVDLKSKVSGDLIYLSAQNGQEVKARTLIARIDAQQAQKSVRDAQANLDSAKLSLEKLKQPADYLSILQAENTLAQAQESKQSAIDAFNKVYDDGFNNVSNAFLDLPTIMTGLQDLLFGYSFSTNQQNIDYYANSAGIYDTTSTQYRDDSYTKYQAAREKYDANFLSYKSASRFSDTTVIEDLIDQTYETTKSMAEVVKSTNNLIQFYKDKLIEHNVRPQSAADTHLSSLNTYTSKTNSHLLNLLSIKTEIQTDKEAIVNAERNIAEKTESLANLKAGADALDIQSQELSVKQRENSLLDAKEELANYYIYAPFDGVIAEVNVKKGDSISSGTALATLITKMRTAEISLNEVDVAKVKVGQKTTLTFDAVEGLTISGEVIEIDTLGTVTQGVVVYDVKIGFDTQDERIKPGMSVNAAIITDIKQDALYIPNSAIKSENDTNYVEILVNNAPQQRAVELGISNDTDTEIISGLQEGEEVITRTVTGTTATTQTQNSSGAVRVPGLGGFGR